MPIPKTIVQTYKTAELPFITQWHIRNMKKANPGYTYEFFTDKEIADFILVEYGVETLKVYEKLNIGAAKADFFRYAYLYKKGGVYLDIDSLLVAKLDEVIAPTDSAVITLEGHLEYFVQWALVYEAGHPFLKRTLEIVIDNIEHNRYPTDVHKMTGPAAYTQAIKECLAEDPSIPHRELGVDYDHKFQFSYPLSKVALYGLFKTNHWKNQSKVRPVLNTAA